MKINSMKAEGVHGLLKFNINFRDQVTFLIGINGSGKTSALKLLFGFIGPSFDYINQVSFERVEITCSSVKNEKDILISAKKVEKNIIEITLKQADVNKIKNIFEVIEDQDELSDIPREERLRRIESLREKFNDTDAVTAIKKLTTPIFLGLDRRFFERRSEWNYSERFLRGRRSQFSLTDPINRSLIDVQQLVFNYFRLMVPKQADITQKFKNKIFAKFFEFTVKKEINSIDIKQLENIKDKAREVEDAVSKLNIEDIKDIISDYFSSLEAVYKSFNKVADPKKWDKNEINLAQTLIVNLAQLKRFDDVIHFSQEYQNDLTLLHEPIERLKNIGSEFFKESQKQLTIKGSGEINILLQNKESATIFELSSGEKQILIMIAHLIFREDQLSNVPGIFIIDEPELSLHLAWQKIFVDSIIKASPNTQFILATHSPAIISNEEREEFCEDLSRG